MKSPLAAKSKPTQEKPRKRQGPQEPKITRRQFLAGLAALAGAFTLGKLGVDVLKDDGTSSQSPENSAEELTSLEIQAKEKQEELVTGVAEITQLVYTTKTYKDALIKEQYDDRLTESERRVVSSTQKDLLVQLANSSSAEKARMQIINNYFKDESQEGGRATSPESSPEEMFNLFVEAYIDIKRSRQNTSIPLGKHQEIINFINRQPWNKRAMLIIALLNPTDLSEFRPFIKGGKAVQRYGDLGGNYACNSYAIDFMRVLLNDKNGTYVGEMYTADPAKARKTLSPLGQLALSKYEPIILSEENLQHIERTNGTCVLCESANKTGVKISDSNLFSRWFRWWNQSRLDKGKQALWYSTLDFCKNPENNCSSTDSTKLSGEDAYLNYVFNRYIKNGGRIDSSMVGFVATRKSWLDYQQSKGEVPIGHAGIVFPLEVEVDGKKYLVVAESQVTAAKICRLLYPNPNFEQNGNTIDFINYFAGYSEEIDKTKFEVFVPLVNVRSSARRIMRLVGGRV